jgi:drug/metabolite transporter (DMT)-like permease
VFFAIFFLLSKRSRPDIGVVPFLTGVMLTASVLVTAFVVVAGEPVVEATATDLVYALVVAAGPGFLGHVVMTWPLRWIPANIPPVMRLGTPVLASTWAWLFLGDTVGALQVVGGLITAGGVAGAVLSRDGRELVRAEQAAATAGVSAPAAASPRGAGGTAAPGTRR